MKPPVITCALVISLASFSPASEASPLAVEVEDAADHHVAAQGSFRGGLPHSWEYTLGTRRSAPNITGITAHGLLAAHRLTRLQEHEASALRAARSLIAAYDRGWNQRRPYTQDIEFLAAAGFVIDAARWFQLSRSHFSAPAYVAYVLEGRRASGGERLAAWDLASTIRAAVAVGQLEYARGLLGELLRRRHEWDKSGAGQWLARGSLLWAMAVVRDRLGLTPEQRQLAESLVRELRSAQRTSGAWQEAGGGKLCTQTTAYAILGLGRWSSGQSAAGQGRAWLRRSAQSDRRFFVGGRMWATTYHLDGRPEDNYNNEIQSEAMLALASER